MAGTILTPAAIWRDFIIDEVPKAEIISQSKSGSLNYTELFIEGRKADDGLVKIYATLTKSKASEKAPAILLLGDFNHSVKAVQDDLAKKGYIVLTVDLAGAPENKEERQNYTVYPESLSYANYLNVNGAMDMVEEDINHTCWYEWAVVTRYALAYLKDLEDVTKVGGFAFGEASTVMWQVAGMDDKLDCACFALNAGWSGYRGMYKFAGTVEPHFSTNMLKFIAGVEPQSYAMHVNCPVLMLSATNSDVYDVDRAYDTISRIGEEHYRAMHYSVGYTNSISVGGYENALIFFDKTLNKKGNASLPKEMDVKCEIENGSLKIEVSPYKRGLESISVYVSEQTIKPSLRAWRDIGEAREITKKGEHVFEYLPYSQSGLVTIFAKARYESGFSLCSPIICKKFSPEEVKPSYKSNIVYSSRLSHAKTIFSIACKDLGCEQIFIAEGFDVKVKKGPMGIEGVSRKNGLTTFKVNAITDKPKQDAILMFDAHSKTDLMLTVKLIANYLENPQEYLAMVKVYGGNVWHNFKLSMNKFKTAEGMPLKSYDNINAISFECKEGEFLLNNALWV